MKIILVAIISLLMSTMITGLIPIDKELYGTYLDKKGNEVKISNQQIGPITEIDDTCDYQNRGSHILMHCRKTNLKDDCEKMIIANKLTLFSRNEESQVCKYIEELDKKSNSILK